MAENKDAESHCLAPAIRHLRHPTRAGLLTLAGDADTDIPDLTAQYVLEAAEIEDPILPDRD